MRSALLLSLGLHAAGLAILGLALRPRFAVPPRIQVIPVDLFALPAPAAAVVERAQPASAVAHEPAPRDHPVDATPQRDSDRRLPHPRRETGPRDRLRGEAGLRTPARAAQGGETSERLPQRAPTPDLPRRGSADPKPAVQSELPRVGDSRGAMQMRVEGEVQPYAYYLSIVQRKIASFWEPPAGIERQPGEVAVIVWFRIEKDGTVETSYVEEPSGIGPFDTSALRALTHALPLPRLPDEYPGDHLIIHLRFVYSREAGVPAGTP